MALAIDMEKMDLKLRMLRFRHDRRIREKIGICPGVLLSQPGVCASSTGRVVPGDEPGMHRGKLNRMH
ncbi:hypothetical protein MSTO_36430 [Mycobacterium stomatepiae]|uniref:Uncharacterized protein n=1 Tax=Mycobacterium stomatepiae TaxID=470076 RepID=A0A7I7QAV3_9MYCO|nr:hypothetical protein MSTO_36430 [Mycobacterium stomatepiae]